jgi:hypothetical protein
MKLSQRKLFLKREYTLGKDSLTIRTSDLTSSETLKIPYEDIDTSNLIEKKQTDNILLVITIVFGVFFLINILNPNNYSEDGLLGVAVFLFLVAFASGFLTYLKSKNVVLIPTAKNGYIEVLKNKPSTVQFNNFILELTIKIASFLRTKYANIDLDLPKEPQLLNLAWLKDREVISQEEFEKLKSELTNKGIGENPVGFNK